MLRSVTRLAVTTIALGALAACADHATAPETRSLTPSARSDAAALQLAAMEDETAAALLTKLEAKAASAVMAEMDPERAAKLAGIISGAARIPKPKKPKPPAEAGAQGKPQAENSPAPPAGAPASGGTAQPQGSRS